MRIPVGRACHLSVSQTKDAASLTKCVLAIRDWMTSELGDGVDAQRQPLVARLVAKVFVVADQTKQHLKVSWCEPKRCRDRLRAKLVVAVLELVNTLVPVTVNVEAVAFEM